MFERPRISGFLLSLARDGDRSGAARASFDESLCGEMPRHGPHQPQDSVECLGKAPQPAQGDAEANGLRQNSLHCKYVDFCSFCAA